MKKNLTVSTLLFEVARLVEESYDERADCWACCDAIHYIACCNEVKSNVLLTAKDYFSAMFAPKRHKLFWFGEVEPQNAPRRILALYFAAHAAKSEGL